MKKKFFFAAMALVALASCSTDEMIEVSTPQDNSPSGESNAIVFASASKGITRADIYGDAAATLLGNNFYVTGTKGTEPDDSPTTTEVFDNYLVHYDKNTAGKTTSNTANWEYVGIDQAPTSGSPTVADRAKLSLKTGAQTIKYWDYSAAQYDFLAFSTGTFPAVKGNSTATTNIGVTAMKYGVDLKSPSIAYTFDLPSVDALKNAYITDITEVTKTSGKYGKEVQLKFKNLGSKVRIALYETIPGYSVKDVKFYQVDGTNADFATATTYDESYLIGDNNNSFPTKAKIEVYFPHVGNTNASEADYDVAAATVEPASGDYEKFKTFGALTAQLKGRERAEVKKVETDDGSGGTNVTYPDEDGNVFLGRDLPNATFAGSADAAFYETVFPVSTAYPLTLRVDYILVPIDGATETIKIHGARAVVPSTYTKWQPNYAYTYIFKISDDTSGWTSTVTTDPAGLFPITFDAVVAEAIDATAEQTTITTVATPTITTYQQYHAYTGPTTTPDEYSKSVKNLDGNTVDRDIYVQVMNNKNTPAVLYTDLNTTTPTNGTKRSLLYAISGSAPISEATVMDALQNRTTALNETNVTGRNGMTLTNNTNISATVDEIVNGVDDNPIDLKVNGVAESGYGKAAKLDISELTAGTTYAFVYDYTSASGGKVVKEIYQPIATVTSPTPTPVGSMKYITTSTLDGISTTTAANEAVDHAYIYFSKTNQTTDASTNPVTYSYTYSFVSVDGKETLPAGLIKVAKSSLLTTGSSATADANTFYFTIYNRNDGKYAVKVIKIVD